MVIYNGQQERVISDAISECSSFTFDSSCFEKRSESHSNGMLMYSSTEMGVFFFFFYTAYHTKLLLMCLVLEIYTKFSPNTSFDKRFS